MTRNSLARAACAALLLGLASPLAAQQKEPPLPPPLPMEPVEFPAYHERQLPNGASLLVVEHHEQPVVNVSIAIPGGASAEPAEKAGLADMAADLLDNGTTTRSAKDLAEASDFIGASLGAGAAADWTRLSLTVTTEFLDEGLDLLADVLLNPAFTEQEIETLRRRTLTALRTQLSQPSAVASRHFMGEIFPDHPYGRSRTPETVGRITRQDLVDFHRDWMRPAEALVVVAGDVRADDIERRLSQRLSGWTGAPPRALSFQAPPERSERLLYFVHQPGTVQAVIRVGHPMPSATEADWATLDVANRILGGGSSSWLFKVLRAEKGYTYGAYSGMAERRHAGYFQATAEVRNEVADSAMAELLSLIQRLRAEPVPARDLDEAKAYLTGSFPLTIETPQNVAGQLASTLLLGRPVSWLEEYRGRLAGVEPDDVQRAARAQIHPERAAVVVVGDATQILDALRPFADRVRLVDAEGQPVTLADLAPRASTRAYAVENLIEGTLTYAVQVQGRELGEMTVATSREVLDGRPVVRIEQSVGTPMGAQTQSVLFDAETVRPISASLSGGGLSAELTFTDGRVSGELNLPTGETRDLSADLPEGTLVSPMDGPLLSVTDLSEAEFEIPMFTPGQGVAQLTFVMAGEETVEVPAGSIEAYRIEVGGPQPSTLWVRKEYPHIPLKQELKAQPIAFELKQLP